MAATDHIDDDRDSVSAAFIRHSAFLKRFVARYFSGRDDVDDVVQETYLRAFAAESKQVIDHPKAFLFHVAKNVALSKLAQKSRQVTDYLEDVEATAGGTAASPDQELAAQELLGLYCGAVATFSEKCREVFLLRKVHGLSHKEIADRMSLSVSSVEKYLRQGLLACDAYIREHETPRTPKR